MIDLARARITDPDDRERLERFLRYVRTLAPRAGLVYEGQITTIEDESVAPSSPPISGPSGRPTADLSFSHLRHLPGSESGHRLTLTVSSSAKEILAEYLATLSSNHY